MRQTRPILGQRNQPSSSSERQHSCRHDGVCSFRAGVVVGVWFGFRFSTPLASEMMIKSGMDEGEHPAAVTTNSRLPRWIERVKSLMTKAELDELRVCLHRGRPIASEHWIEEAAKRHDLWLTLRPIGRSRIQPFSTKKIKNYPRTLRFSRSKLGRRNRAGRSTRLSSASSRQIRLGSFGRL